MKFTINKTSRSANNECPIDGAICIRKAPTENDDWVCGQWIIEIDSLQNLMNIAEKKTIIVSAPMKTFSEIDKDYYRIDGLPNIEIYDSHRE